MLQHKLTQMYQILFEHFGHRRWWPGNSPLEVCVGAILTQNTSWKNVEKAITNLKNAGNLKVSLLHKISTDELATLIKPAGYYNIKAKRLKNFITHLVKRHQGSLDSMFQADVDELRTELLSINGVGKETADCMILYAANKPIFVIDAYTKRVLERHGIVGQDADYDSMQMIFHRNLKEDLALFNDFHAQFVAVGSRHCRRNPKCAGCPLERLGGGDQ